MSLTSRLALAAVVVVVDFLAFAVPLAAILAAYVIVARPPVFLHGVVRLYEDRPPPSAP